MIGEQHSIGKTIGELRKKAISFGSRSHSFELYTKRVHKEAKG